MRSSVSILALVSLGQWALAQSQYRLECLLLGGLGEIAAEQGILGPAATQFCSSFITDRATQTVFFTTTGTSVITSRVPATLTVSNPNCVPTAIAARQVANNDSGDLSDFVKEAISLACTCLHLAPTVTATRTIGLATSIAVVTAPVATTTVCSGTPGVPRFGQCGGAGYTGPTRCIPPAVCQFVSNLYSQCV